MKRSQRRASLLAYLGTVLIIVGLLPEASERLEPYPLAHAAWHLVLFAGAALLVYGLETLRALARRHKRMIT